MNEHTLASQRARNERAAKQAQRLGDAVGASPEAVAVLERRLAAKSHVADAAGYLAKVMAFEARGEFTTTTNIEEASDERESRR